jgi:hypothetical protein
MIQLKKSTASLLPLILLLTVTNTGCTLSRMVKQAEKQEISVTPNPLAATGEHVIFEMKATLPQKLLKDNYRYKIDVHYEAEGQKREHVGALNFDIGEYLYEQGKPTITREFSLTRTQYGVAASVLFLSAVVVSLQAGRVVRRCGADRLIRVLLAHAVIALIVIAVAPGWHWVLVGAVVMGVPLGLMNPVTNQLIAGRVIHTVQGTVTGIKQSGVQMGALVIGVGLRQAPAR